MSSILPRPGAARDHQISLRNQIYVTGHRFLVQSPSGTGVRVLRSTYHRLDRALTEPHL